MPYLLTGTIARLFSIYDSSIYNTDIHQKMFKKVTGGYQRKIYAQEVEELNLWFMFVD